MTASGTKLRIGFVSGQRSIQRWQAEAAVHVRNEAGIESVVWIAVDQKADPVTRVKPVKRTGLLARIAHLLPQTLRPETLTEQDPVSLFHGLPVLSIATMKGSPDLSTEVMSELAALRLDIVLVLSPIRPDAAELGHPRLGVWTFHPGLSAPMSGEDLFNHPTRAALQLNRYDADGTTRVLREGRFANNAPGAPPIDAVLMNCALWPTLVMREVLAGRSQAAEGSADAALAQEQEESGTLGELQLFWRGWRRTLFRPRVENNAEWNIGLLHQPIGVLLDADASMNVRWLPPPSMGKSRSEPFGYVAEDGQLNVLYRKHSITTGQSSIARLRPKTDNVLKRSRPMLEGAGITGYPYVVEDRGAVYVVVTHTTGTDLYRLNPTNDGLDRVTVLVDKPLQAPTLFFAEERWWLFATDPALPETALLAFHAQHLEGPYIPHAQNPLKLDVSCARPAGTPFQRDGSWWRPALDASVPGTSAVVLNRILTLTPELFVEETVKRVDLFSGTQYGHGSRTVCAMGPITLVDGLRSPMVAANRANASRGKKRSGSKKHA